MEHRWQKAAWISGIFIACAVLAVSCLWLGQPQSAPVQAPQFNAAAFSSACLPSRSDEALRNVTEQGADDESISALQELFDLCNAFSQQLQAQQPQVSAYLQTVGQIYELLLQTQYEQQDYLEIRGKIDALLASLDYENLPQAFKSLVPRFNLDLEHDVRFALQACYLRSLRRQEQKNGVVSMTVAGDTTFGQYPEVPQELSFAHEFALRGNDLSFPLRAVSPFFQNDSLSVLNCEGTFTEAEQMANKRYRFKGPAQYISMFQNGGVEIVNLANNHTYDYLQQGYDDTVSNLDRYGIKHYGDQSYLIYEAEGIIFGFFGYDLFNQMPTDMEYRLKRDIAAVKEQGAQVVIATFHWGLEYSSEANWFQISTAHLAVDLGADVVIGHHPHVLQGIEQYKGKPIFYSLGNFAFGGDEELKDGGDTMLARLTFQKSADGSILQGDPLIIPANVSTVTDRNNYMPRPLFGEEATRLMQRLAEFSAQLPNGLSQLHYLN